MSRRVLICGSRDYRDNRHLKATLDRLHAEEPFAVLIHGAAAGADSMARVWATWNDVPTLAFPADWDNCDASCPPGHRRTRRNGTTYCSAAGPRRNRQMMQEGKPELVVAFFSRPGTPGTSDMCEVAESAGMTPLTFVAGTR